jgi:cyclic pyranopterin phosphate synthase
MPNEGMKFLPREEILSYEEMERLIKLLVSMGIRKVRITGGEPFVKKDMIDFLERICAIDRLEEVHITTNGVLTAPYIPKLKEIGIKSVNLSLDTTDKEKFKKITFRDEYDKVMESFHSFIAHGIRLKINMVVMDNQNTEDILPMVKLAQDYPVDVRFIEEMPFNGDSHEFTTPKWNYKQIIAHIKEQYPEMQPASQPPHSTSSNYVIPGFKGEIGVIAAYSRTFCHDCNRIRITAKGTLKNCLYDNGVLDLKSLLREGKTDKELQEILIKIFKTRPKDGFEADQYRESSYESMTTIGG